MAGKRSYGDPCGIARALDAVGDRWALLVVRELLLGPKRFTDLRAGLPGAATDVLTQRLRELTDVGVVERATLPPPGAATVYRLTGRGRELEPVLLALGRWGSRQPFPAGDRELGTDAFAVALSTTFDPAAAADLDATVVLDLGADRVRAHVHDGRLDLTRGDAGEADATITGDVATLREVLWRGEKPGTVGVEGDRGTARRFLTLFRT
jgi:DNA-binding HxlR family transcriptional regulator